MGVGFTNVNNSNEAAQSELEVSFFADGIIIFEVPIRVEHDDFATYRIGMASSLTTGDPSDGIFFKFDTGVDSFFILESHNDAATNTQVTSTFAIPASPFEVRLRMEAIGANYGEGPVVKYYVDDVFVGEMTVAGSYPTGNAGVWGTVDNSSHFVTERLFMGAFTLALNTVKK
jgi:hypothetical protein